MECKSRKGIRKSRDQLKRRTPELGYYFIVTDASETEQNYFLGLRDSIPKELQGKLVIKVSQTRTIDLVDEASSMASMQSQYSEPWIIFDRDQIIDFDNIIKEAERKGIKVGWSNPCIEEWFSAYFGTMPVYPDSTSCCKGFSHDYYIKTKQKYNKADDKIYNNLNIYGNEQLAFNTAKQKLDEHKRECKENPSEMNPATTVHILVEEIKNKINNS